MASIIGGLTDTVAIGAHAPAGSAPATVGFSPQIQATLVSAIDAKLVGTPLAGKGSAFVTTGYKYGVDPWLLVSSAKLESSLGTAGFATNGSHNPFGLGGGAGYRYPSWEAAIDAAGQNLAGPLYRGDKRYTLDQIYSRWSTANDSVRLAAIYSSLTGNTVDKSLVVLAPGPNTYVNNGTVGGAGIVHSDVPSVLNPLDAIGKIADILKFLVNPAMWLRVGEMGIGVVGMIAGGYLLAKGDESLKPVAVLVFSVSFMWLYCGVKAISPLEFLKGMVGA